MNQILLIEDDPQMGDFTNSVLKQAGFAVTLVSTAEEALQCIQLQMPHAIVSDVHLPGISGIKLCEILKSQEKTRKIPFIFLTIDAKEIEKVRGLKMGADDYMTKPFSSKELVARIEAVLRRVDYRAGSDNIFEVGALRLDAERREAFAGGRPLKLRKMEFALLKIFLREPGKMLTRDYINQKIWQDDVIVTENALNAHIKNLRAALGSYKDMIQTFKGEGYRLMED